MGPNKVPISAAVPDAGLAKLVGSRMTGNTETILGYVVALTKKWLLKVQLADYIRKDYLLKVNLFDL
jgi:hypothetical protein